MFDPETHLDFVEIIRRKTELQTEAGIRTAINRSYFSSMLKAKSRLEELGIKITEKNEIHKEVIEKIKEKNNKMGDKLNTLYEMKVDADYNLDIEIKNIAITPSYGLAKSFNNKVDSRII